MSFIKYFFCIKRLLLRNKTYLLVIFLSISFSLVLRDESSKQYFGSIHVCLIKYLTSKICRYSSFNYFVPGIILKCPYIRFLFIQSLWKWSSHKTAFLLNLDTFTSCPLPILCSPCCTFFRSVAFLGSGTLKKLLPFVFFLWYSYNYMLDPYMLDKC